MGLTLINRHKNYTLGIWEITESLEEIKKSINDDNYKTFKSLKRQKEYLCTRLLLREIDGNLSIIYNKWGAPTLNTDDNISISHSKNIIAVIVSKKNVAIDIEMISKKPLKIMDKFLSHQDNISNTIEETTLAWSAKETIYKLHQKGGIDYKSDIKIKEINCVKNQISVLFKDNDIVLNYNKLNNHFLVYVCI